jgi:hypothetical protein
MLCDCEWLAAEFETGCIERLSQERIPVQIQQIARRSIQRAGLSVEEKLPVFVSVDRRDINAATFGVTLEMEEEVAAVGKELRPTVRLLGGRSIR